MSSRSKRSRGSCRRIGVPSPEGVVLPFTSEMPSESDPRLGQAQLMGWLEGLFHGIQTAMFNQQEMARGQFTEMRRHALEAASGTGAPSAGPSPYL